MADGYIQVAADSTGKKLQTFSNTVGGNTVHVEAVTLTDSSGAVIATLPVSIAAAIQSNEVPDATATYAPSNSTSTAYESSRLVKASAGVLFAITGYNSSATDQFIQIHDASSLPADTAVPVIMFLVRATRNFSLSFGGKFGRYFSTGIVICNSSTGPTKTIGSADCWFDAQYK